ncbi:MAG: hypothetical protein Q9182_005695 [Xanthomendoza sp. 2 TL-2023]
MPFSPRFADVEEYIQSMLNFITSSDLFQHLCGGIHILDFITQEPDLYTAVLPEDWRHFFERHDISDILDLLMRAELSLVDTSPSVSQASFEKSSWRDGVSPPPSLLEYINDIREHCLDRTFSDSHHAGSSAPEFALAGHVKVGMNAKKVHEVSNLARYVYNLSTDISFNHSHRMSHLVDFGSGQNYLGRALASPPYNQRVIALESKPLNIHGARSMDVTAKLAKKKVIMRDKKQYRSVLFGNHYIPKPVTITPNIEPDPTSQELSHMKSATLPPDSENNIQYIETIIKDGNLSSIIPETNQFFPSLSTTSSDPQLHNMMIISLHSCGNLLHHGLRSLTMNPFVQAVALVGCCYNLLTERLPPTSPPQTSTFRPHNDRLTQTSSTRDPHGFPMSERFMTYKHHSGEGIRFNITARMMAVQAPQNWTQADCNSFFTRHFYRAVFQRLLLDKGIIDRPQTVPTDNIKQPRDPQKKKNPPIILGSLRKPAYASFLTYTRAAISKLLAPASSPHASLLQQKNLPSLTDAEITAYETRYAHRKKHLAILWSLMAFSAQVVESAIVVDRWSWLQEQKEVKEAWVESVFEYAVSPRNLVVVGVKG